MAGGPSGIDSPSGLDGVGELDGVGPRPWADTTELRSGALFDDEILALLPLVGVWADRDGGEQITFSHNGEPYLSYDRIVWDVATGRLVEREHGFWRLEPGSDNLVVTAVTVAGQCEIFTGVAGDVQWVIASYEAIAVTDALLSQGERRYYSVADDVLSYQVDRLDASGALVTVRSAALPRL